MNSIYQSNIQPIQGCDIQFILKSNTSLVISKHEMDMSEFGYSIQESELLYIRAFNLQTRSSEYPA